MQTPILENIYLENKERCLMENFSINLTTYEADNPISIILNDVCSNSFLPYININTCHEPRSKT